MTAIRGFRLVTADPERSLRFYMGLGFAAGERTAIDPAEMAVLGIGGAGERQALTLGPSHLDLDGFAEAGRPYPADADAADTVFQHLALVTTDIAAAWDRALAAGATPISRAGPVRLPAASGGVTAVKFRDLDGHPLELLQFPAGTNPHWRGEGLLGIDHSAIAVADVAASRAFYELHGLTLGTRSLNRGSAQAALDGLDDPVVDVVPLDPAATPPHVELLGYRAPAMRTDRRWHPADVAATRIVWRGAQPALLADPDGHLHQLEA